MTAGSLLGLGAAVAVALLLVALVLVAARVAAVRRDAGAVRPFVPVAPPARRRRGSGAVIAGAGLLAVAALLAGVPLALAAWAR